MVSSLSPLTVLWYLCDDDVILCLFVVYVLNYLVFVMSAFYKYFLVQWFVHTLCVHVVNTLQYVLTDNLASLTSLITKARPSVVTGQTHHLIWLLLMVYSYSVEEGYDATDQYTVFLCKLK